MQHIDQDPTTAGRSDVAVDPGRTVLVVVDMQNCFVADSPVSAPLGPEVATRLNRLAGACRESGITVIWTRHVVRRDGSNVGLLGEKIPAVAHGVINARSSGIDTIIVGGINTNVCVDTTAREAAVREFRVLFLSDGTANFDLPDGGLGAASAEELQRAACAVMAFGFADVVTVDEVLDRIPVAASS